MEIGFVAHDLDADRPSFVNVAWSRPEVLTLGSVGPVLEVSWANLTSKNDFPYECRTRKSTLG